MSLQLPELTEEQLEVLRNSDLSINLLLTRRCNYQCDHCMYASGPRLPGAYMSRDDLRHIQDFVEHMRERGLPISLVNLVGGEPTLDLDEFDRCFQSVSDWGIEMEMTTNGWWLDSMETISRLAKIVYGKMDPDDFSFRISDSPYHRKFRSPNAQRILENLRGFFSDVVCPSFDEAENGSSDSGDSSYWLGLMQQAVELGFVFVSTMCSSGDQISPVGRARQSDLVPAWQDGPCGVNSRAFRWTFMPGGILYDVCCNGGMIPTRQRLDPETLLRLNWHYMEDLHAAYPDPKRAGHNALGGKRCLNCPSFAAKWMREQARKSEHAFAGCVPAWTNAH